MLLSFRWFGAHDAVTLANIRQVPGVGGIVTSLHHRAPGEPWALDDVERVRDTVHEAGFVLPVIESIPVHEDIKLGVAGRDRAVDTWCESLRSVGAAGIGVVCYNFMPIFDWLRTDLSRVTDDGSSTLAFDHEVLDGMDLSGGFGTLPAWADTYDGPQTAALLARYRALPDEALWEHLSWFLERVVPVAESVGVKLALHPDDPPWPVLGIPRIVGNLAALQRATRLVDRPANGITFCTGSLGAAPANDLPAMVRALEGRIHFAHCRNVKVTGLRRFVETPHPSRFGDVDMRAVLLALRETGFEGPMRPDHGRMIWGETGRPGYGLHDRALGAMYLQGLWEGLTPTT